MEGCFAYALSKVGCSSITLKPEQKACIKCIFDGEDVFMWLPTGFGKSVCYEVIPFVFDEKLCRDNNLVVIISPPFSLMVDQVHSLRSRSVKASVMTPIDALVCASGVPFCCSRTKNSHYMLGKYCSIAQTARMLAIAKKPRDDHVEHDVTNAHYISRHHSRTCLCIHVIFES